MKRIIFCLLPLFSRAADYPASLFGIRSDGNTLNTRSIQYAVDYIHDKGGGRLVFEVGRYLTGSIHLRSNVNIELKKGAMLVGSVNPLDYDRQQAMALLLAEEQENIAITGNGVIDGQGRQVALNVIALVRSGVIEDPLGNDRPREANRPMLIYFRSCRNITIQDITLKNAASWVQSYDQVKNLKIDHITVDSRAYWNNDGVDIVDCDSVSITNSYIDAADDGICLKSHQMRTFCNNILIYNNTIRSSANAIKFGTASHGGFRNVRIIRNKVFDTYRSAIAIECVDGGFLDSITVDSLQAFHTGNAIFLRLGERVKERKGSLSNVQISNVTVIIPAGKPDAGYDYEGPVEDMPRNISPIVIAGLPGQYITNVRFNNIEVKYPGGGNTLFANVPLGHLDSIPEIPEKYPEFSMFRELPAWGIYIRHARELQFSNIRLSCEKKDYRVPIVIDDVHNAQFFSLHIQQPGGKKKNIYLYKSSGIDIGK